MLDFDKRQLISLLEISRVIHGFDQGQEKENCPFLEWFDKKKQALSRGEVRENLGNCI